MSNGNGKAKALAPEHELGLRILAFKHQQHENGTKISPELEDALMLTLNIIYGVDDGK